MVATVIINRWTGAGPSASAITSINTRANAYDTHSTADTTNPVKIKYGVTQYSYKVSTQLFASTTPTGTIDNIKWYTDGALGFGTGITCQVKAVATYTQATGTPGDTGVVMTGGADAETKTSAAPLSVTGSITNPNTGAIGYFVDYQLVIADTAGPDASAAETFTFSYDET